MEFSFKLFLQSFNPSISDEDLWYFLLVYMNERIDQMGLEKGMEQGMEKLATYMEAYGQQKGFKTFRVEMST